LLFFVLMAFQFLFDGAPKSQLSVQVNKNVVPQDSLENNFDFSTFGKLKVNLGDGNDSGLSFLFNPSSSKGADNSSNDKKISVFGKKSQSSNFNNSTLNNIFSKSYYDDNVKVKDSDTLINNKLTENESDKFFFGKNIFKNEIDKSNGKISNEISSILKNGESSLQSCLEYLKKISIKNICVDSDTIKRVNVNGDEEEFGVNKNKLYDRNSFDRVSTFKQLSAVKRTLPFNRSDKTTSQNDMDKHKVSKKCNQSINKGKIIVTDYRTAHSKILLLENICLVLEYYTKFVQRRVLPYGCNKDGSFNINLLLKDFKESIADQEYSLPNKLKTEEYLIKTLKYLFSMIHRTKSIRKDLMQQRIKLKNTIQIFGIFARFRIYVSYRLCILNALEFSQKLNNKHLSKSMHSIQKMLYNLAKENKFCDNEVEFSCYGLLMNLHDSNVLLKTNCFKKNYGI
uniref:SAC3/GANP/THP3 conserved domain-containing protein n=1 Tax=Strongyloides stercoralis TaxID=6248 RepID=A0AAF5I4D8_STRER